MQWRLLREKVIKMTSFARKSNQTDDFCTKKQIFVDFRRVSWIFVNFHWGAKNCWKSRKTKFYVFCLFTSLYRRFRLSRVSHAQECEEIYRLVSKIISFMPCGSVFDRFCVLWKNIVESPSKIYLKYKNVLKSMKHSWQSMKIYENVGQSMKLDEILWKSIRI